MSETIRFDLFRGIAAKAMFKLSDVLSYGAKKYSPNGWHLVSPQEHLNHALTHAFAWLAGDTGEDHVSHFHCRAMMFAATMEDPRWTQDCLPQKETYGEMLNRHHKEIQEFKKVKEHSEKEFFEEFWMQRDKS